MLAVDLVRSLLRPSAHRDEATSPALEIEMRLRIVAEDRARTLEAMLAARDADVARLQRENDHLLLGALARVTRITERRNAERLTGRSDDGRFAESVA